MLIILYFVICLFLIPTFISSVFVCIFVFICFLSLHQAANPFFKLLTMLMEFAGGPPGMPSFASYILQRIWEVNADAEASLH